MSPALLSAISPISPASARSFQPGDHSLSFQPGDHSLSFQSEAGDPSREIPDTLSLLGTKLAEYVRTLEPESPEVRHQECDFLIASSKDPQIRQYIAVKLYDLFLHSRVMGAEESAVYIVDRYFSTGEIAMYNQEDLFAAEIFADFNRSSLLGCKAPELRLEDNYGTTVTLFAPDPSSVTAPASEHPSVPSSDTSSALASCHSEPVEDSPCSCGCHCASDCACCGFQDTQAGSSLALRRDSPQVVTGDRYTVLYFYDTGCVTCKVTTPQLVRLLESRTEALDIYPIYTGDDYMEWQKYIAANFSTSRYHNLWDPDFSSDFQTKYGVLSTPKLFLIAPDGTIIGRGLDPSALGELLNMIK